MRRKRPSACVVSECGSSSYCVVFVDHKAYSPFLSKTVLLRRKEVFLLSSLFAFCPRCLATFETPTPFLLGCTLPSLISVPISCEYSMRFRHLERDEAVTRLFRFRLLSPPPRLFGPLFFFSVSSSRAQLEKLYENPTHSLVGSGFLLTLVVSLTGCFEVAPREDFGDQLALPFPVIRPVHRFTTVWPFFVCFVFLEEGGLP